MVSHGCNATTNATLRERLEWGTSMWRSNINSDAIHKGTMPSAWGVMGVMSWHVVATKKRAWARHKVAVATRRMQEHVASTWMQYKGVQAKRRLDTHTSHIYRYMWHHHCNCSLNGTRTLSPSRSGWCHSLVRVLVELGCALLVWQGVGGNHFIKGEQERLLNTRWDSEREVIREVWTHQSYCGSLAWVLFSYSMI